MYLHRRPKFEAKATELQHIRKMQAAHPSSVDPEVLASLELELEQEKLSINAAMMRQLTIPKGVNMWDDAQEGGVNGGGSAGGKNDGRAAATASAATVVVTTATGGGSAGGKNDGCAAATASAATVHTTTATAIIASRTTEPPLFNFVDAHAHRNSNQERRIAVAPPVGNT